MSGIVDAERDHSISTAWDGVQSDVCILTGDAGSGLADGLVTSCGRAMWASEHGIHHVAWPLYGPLGSAAIRRGVESVMRQTYGALQKEWKEELVTLRGVGVPVILDMPPIATLVIDRCRGEVDKLFDEAVSISEDFRGFRKTYARLQEQFRKPEDLTIGQLSQRHREYVMEVSGAIRGAAQVRTDSRLALEMWDAIAQLEVGGKVGAPELGAGLRLSDLLTKGLRGCRIKQIKARACILFDLWKKIQLVKGDLGGVVSKTFKIDELQLRAKSAVAERMAAQLEAAAKVCRMTSWEVANCGD